ncbi:hypothetical protein AAKU55_003072 [Oxalobacteraceae bacterium GrIS 1.11]
MEPISHPAPATAQNSPVPAAGKPNPAEERAAHVRAWLQENPAPGLPDPAASSIMRLWLLVDLANLQKSTPELAAEFKKTFAGNCLAFPEYAKILNDMHPKLSREIKPLVDLFQVADFIGQNLHRTREAINNIVQYADPALKALLSDEAAMRDMEAPLAARLHWIDTLHLKKFGALIASALGRPDAAERQREADDAHARSLRSENDTDPFHPARLDREARTVADFIAANHNLYHWKIAANIGQAAPDLHAILGDVHRMNMLDPIVNARLAGLPGLQVSETQAVIANALKRTDAAMRTDAANSARAAAGLDQGHFDPWRDVEAVAEFVAINHRLDPHIIFQNLAAASKELKAIFADRAHLESIEPHIRRTMPASAGLAIANFHEVAALAFDRGDARQRAIAADSARQNNGSNIDIDKPPAADARGQAQGNMPAGGATNQPAPHRADGDIASSQHRLAMQQAHLLNCFVLPNARKSDAAVIAAFNEAPPAVKSLLGDPVRMGELVALLGMQSGGVDPVDLKRIQTLLARHANGIPSPAQAGRGDNSASDPSDSIGASPAPPARPLANGFRPAGPLPPDRPIPALVAGILERITYKTQADGSVLYSLDGCPAFVDHGDQILMAGDADHDEQSIVAALLVAKEKYGGAFELTGDIEFKRRTIEIMIKYKIDAMLKSPEQDAMRREIAKAKQAGTAQPASAENPATPVDLKRLVAHGDATPDAGKPASPARAPINPSAPANPPAEPVKRLAGKVLGHGPAPYEHNPKQSMSYFVELENADGRTRTTWGVDLERVANDQGLNTGDTVVLQNLGRTPVEVKQDIQDRDGNVIGSEIIVSHRNEWEIEFVERIGPPEDHDASDAPPIPGNAPASFVDAEAWWTGQHTLIQNLSIDYAEMQADLGRLGPKPAAGQVYWFDGGRPSAPPPDAAQILDQYASDSGKATPAGRYEIRPAGAGPAIHCSTPSEAMANAERLGLAEFHAVGIDASTVTVRKHGDTWQRDDGVPLNPPHERGPSDRAELIPVMHAIRTLPDDKSIASLLLFKSEGNDYLQGFVHIGDQKQQVIAHIVNPEAARSGRTIQLSAMTSTPDGPRWQAIGHGKAINRSDDGRQIHFDEVLFTIGKSTFVARVHNQLSHALRQEIGFDKPRRERSKDESAVAPVIAGPARSKVSKDTPKAPPARKPNRPRGASPKG